MRFLAIVMAAALVAGCSGDDDGGGDQSVDRRVPETTTLAPATTTIDRHDIGPVLAQLRRPVPQRPLKVAVVMFLLSDSTGPGPWTDDEVLDTLVRGEESVNAAVTAISNGRVTLTGAGGPDLYTWSKSDVVSIDERQCDSTVWSDLAEARYDLSAYDRVFILLPRLEPCFWGGLGGPKYVIVSLDPARRDYDQRTMLHEFGHSLNLAHAGRLVCHGPDGARVAVSADCTIEAFDPWTFMGDHVYRGASGWHRFVAGMIPTENVVVLDDGEVVLDDADALGDGTTNLAFVPFADGTRYYVFELHESGVAVRATVGDLTTETDTLLIDATPGSQPDDTSEFPDLADFRDNAMSTGQVFEDPAEGVRVTVVSIDGGQAMLSVE